MIQAERSSAGEKRRFQAKEILWTKTCDGKADTTFEEIKEYCSIGGKGENSVRTFSRARLTHPAGPYDRA